MSEFDPDALDAALKEGAAVGTFDETPDATVVAESVVDEVDLLSLTVGTDLRESPHEMQPPLPEGDYRPPPLPEPEPSYSWSGQTTLRGMSKALKTGGEGQILAQLLQEAEYPAEMTSEWDEDSAPQVEFWLVNAIARKQVASSPSTSPYEPDVEGARALPPAVHSHAVPAPTLPDGAYVHVYASSEADLREMQRLLVEVGEVTIGAPSTFKFSARVVDSRMLIADWSELE